MKKILVTGFDPFGGEQINPALEAIKRLPTLIGDTQIVTALCQMVWVTEFLVVQHNCVERLFFLIMRFSLSLILFLD